MRKKILASILAVITLMQTIPFASAATDILKFNDEGLWITEIYQNDVNRSEASNSRESNGYESITLYDSTTELMEFIEIASTHDSDINLNDTYNLYYDNTLIKITDMSGNSNIVIKKGQSVVIWNYRSDVNCPTEAEFREAMRIPDTAVVLKTETETNWLARNFCVKKKADKSVVSSYTVVSDADTLDGFSIELKVPDLGSDMEVFRAKNTPSAGYVYQAQLNGLVDPVIPSRTYANTLLVTEILADDTNRKDTYGTSYDLMECIEVYNRTSSTVDLNKDFTLKYFVKEGTRAKLTIRNYDESKTDCIGSNKNCTLDSKQSAIIWFYRKANISDYTSFPTIEKFRKAFDIASDTPVYIVTNQNGLANANAGIEIYKNNDDSTQTLVSNYCYLGENADSGTATSVDLRVNPEGPQMIVRKGNSEPTMGKVVLNQYRYFKDDGTSMTLTPFSEAPVTVNQGEDIRMFFRYSEPGILERKENTTFYRVNGEGAWHEMEVYGGRITGVYEVIFPADDVFFCDQIEFYVRSSNRYRHTFSNIYKVDINKINKVDGIRTNISKGQEVKDTITITANDGGDNAKTKIYIDGTKQTTTPMFEKGAYLTFRMEDRENSFKSGITTTKNKFIAYTARCFRYVMDTQSHLIDNKYFTYDSEKGVYNVTLRFWAGTFGAVAEDTLAPEANRDNPTIKKLAMKLPNGKVYYPTAIGPDNADTNDKTNLSTDFEAVHLIGADKGRSPYMDVSFSIPASEVTAVGVKINTNDLVDGEHTLKVTNGTATKTVKFIVDNTNPTINTRLTNNSTLTGDITFNPEATDANTVKSLLVTLDGEEISVPYKTTAYELGAGAHTLYYEAYDLAGNKKTKTRNITVENVDVTSTDYGANNVTDKDAEIFLTVESESDADATFYKARKVGKSKITKTEVNSRLPYIKYEINVGELNDTDTIITNWKGSVTNADKDYTTKMYVQNTVTGKWDKVATANSAGYIMKATFSPVNHLKNGVATVIVQATTDIQSPDLDYFDSNTSDANANWDGESIPADYDFCFAWETDTQYYTQNHPHHYHEMNQWLVDNAKTLRMKYVIHTGDLVDDCDMIYQWDISDAAMKILEDNDIPYGVLGGNHDVGGGLEINDNYCNYFGEDRFASQPHYGESFENNLGHYDLISEDGEDFIIVYMSWNVYQDEIDWMNKVLAEHSDKKAILCFHGYTKGDGTGEKSILDYYGRIVKEQVVAKNPNVFAVLNGHYHGATYETVMFDDDGDGTKERTVYQICTDYQGDEEGGSQYVKFLYFNLDEGKIYMNSYSPYVEDFNYFDNEVEKMGTDGKIGITVDCGIMDVKFNSTPSTMTATSFSTYITEHEVIGTSPVDASTGKATAKLSNLEPETTYYWFAEVTNEKTGYLMTTVKNFSTTEKQEVLGDIDNNGVLNVADATYIQKVLVKLETATDADITRADIDGDSRLSIKDATNIQLYINGLLKKEN